MKLSDWARANGVHPKTAYRWWRVGTLPVPARQVNARVILVDDPGAAARVKGVGSVGLYARVSSHDQRAALDRQVARLSEGAAKPGVRGGGGGGGGGRALRSIAAPFVVASPAGMRVRTRLMVDEADAEVLVAVGEHLGSLAGEDLARRCSQRRLDAKGVAVSRRERKQDLTARCSSRWAGAITRTSEDAWCLAERNLHAEGHSLRVRIGRIRRRLAVAVGGRAGRVRGYASSAERFDKQRRLQSLQSRLAGVEADLQAGRMSICRGGRALAGTRHHLDAAGLDEHAWRQRLAEC